MAYFAEALLDYHNQCTEILRGLVENMQAKLVFFDDFLRIFLDFVKGCTP
jgi:hypothetical protein